MEPGERHHSTLGLQHKSLEYSTVSDGTNSVSVHNDVYVNVTRIFHAGGKARTEVENGKSKEMDLNVKLCEATKTDRERT